MFIIWGGCTKLHSAVFDWHLQDVDLERLRRKLTKGDLQVIVDEMCDSCDADVRHVYAFRHTRGLASELFVRFELEDDTSLSRFREHLMTLSVQRHYQEAEPYLSWAPVEIQGWWNECSGGDEVYSLTLKNAGSYSPHVVIIIDTSTRRVFIWWVYEPYD